ncbi:MAG: OsmC family protein [Spirochaetales bacterium]|nr:OsmC family protein [Spirochaetales bacterium]
MSHTIKAVNTGGMAFEIEQDGHTFTVDAGPSVGGKDQGPRPKALLLSGLAGCTGMDVASILSKMKMPYNTMTIEIDANLTDQHPRVYDKIHLQYIFKGDNLDHGKIEKAINLSQDKYCGVTAMLAKTADISYEVLTE